MNRHTHRHTHRQTHIWVLLVENVSVLIGVIKSAQETGQCALHGLARWLRMDPRWPAHRRGAFKTGLTAKSSVQFSILNYWKQGLRSLVRVNITAKIRHSFLDTTFCYWYKLFALKKYVLINFWNSLEANLVYKSQYLYVSIFICPLVQDLELHWVELLVKGHFPKLM